MYKCIRCKGTGELSECCDSPVDGNDICEHCGEPCIIIDCHDCNGTGYVSGHLRSKQLKELIADER